MKHSVACEVHADTRRPSTTAIDAADARQAKVAEDLIENIAAHFEVLVDLDVNQSAVDEQISVRAADEQRRLAEGRVQHARLGSKVVGPDEHKHVADVLHHRFFDGLQVQQADAIDEIELREVYRGADQFIVGPLVAPTLEVRAQAILRGLDDGADALLRARALAAGVDHRGALLRKPAPSRTG